MASFTRSPSLTEKINFTEQASNGNISNKNDSNNKNEKFLQHSISVDANFNHEQEKRASLQNKSSPPTGSNRAKNSNQTKNQENIHIQKESKAAKTLAIVIFFYLVFLMKIV